MSSLPYRLLNLINGFQVSQAISIITTLGIPDLLRNGPQDCSALAEVTRTHPRSLYRLLRVLAAVGVLNEDNERRFSLTSLGERRALGPGCWDVPCTIVPGPAF